MTQRAHVFRPFDGTNVLRGTQEWAVSLNTLVMPSTRTVTATGSLSLTDSVVLADATGGAITVTLPKAAQASGKIIYVKKIDASANAVTVDGNGAETVEGAANHGLAAQYDAVCVISDGTAWYILGAV